VPAVHAAPAVGGLPRLPRVTSRITRLALPRFAPQNRRLNPKREPLLAKRSSRLRNHTARYRRSLSHAHRTCWKESLRSAAEVKNGSPRHCIGWVWRFEAQRVTCSMEPSLLIRNSVWSHRRTPRWDHSLTEAGSPHCHCLSERHCRRRRPRRQALALRRRENAVHFACLLPVRKESSARAVARGGVTIQRFAVDPLTPSEHEARIRLQ
jgi:hypothetical protein